MASSSSVLSRTLQSITVTKIQELEKQRQSYENHKEEALKRAEERSSVRGRVVSLHYRVKKLDIWSKDELDNMRRWTDQAEYDPCVSDATLSKFEALLRSKLDIESRKFSLADLYSRLLTEWIDYPNNGDSETASLENTTLDEPFEVVETRQKARLQELRDKFESVVLEPLQTDEVEIDNYLSSLFVGDNGERALKKLRDGVSRQGKFMLEDRLDQKTLVWCIKALLKNELLNDEKKASLRDFLRDDAVLKEIRDVLNMRYKNIQNWSWGPETEAKGMPVLPRQSLNGKYRVMMDDDVLEALFTHWIGTSWAVSLKQTLQDVTRYTGIWKHAAKMAHEEKQKRTYFYIPHNEANSVDRLRQTTYREHFFMAPLPSKLFEEAGGYDDDDTGPETDPDRLSPKEIKQLLLRTLATEVVMRRSLDSEVAVVQSDFQWFATGLAHSTIFAVLRFMGFQEDWIAFFKKTLEPPLDMLNGKPVRTRKRGLPMAHVFEKLLGELVLFFMDLAVNQEANMLLYRFHDDLWLAGKPQDCVKAWQTMEKFATLMGLEFNKHKTGSVYLVEGEGRTRDESIVSALPKGPVVMNFLVLDPESGKWVINKEHVQQHVEQLQKQLTASKSVLEWVKTWNSCIGRFFSYTFGDPANCFGRPHLNSILATHKEMQNFLFSGNEENKDATVAGHLKNLISRNFNFTDVPDAFLWIPESLGGLNVQNPFVPLFLVREALVKNPDDEMKKFLTEERREYSEYKKDFDSYAKNWLRDRYDKHFPKKNNSWGNEEPSEPSLLWADAQTYPSFEEYTAWREGSSALLHDTYTNLMAQPYKRDIIFTPEVLREIDRLALLPDMGADMELDGMSSEAKWTIQYHADELFEKFGSLSLVDKSLLPLGVLQAMRSRKVTWQMVL